jgi:UDP-N-acetylmuramyl pentapeptide phosphotransferase/UDP-N-acetylglucosamine-1-phosphate transferase
MKKFFHDLFNDHNSINEKAVIGFMAFVMMCIFAFVDIVTGAMNKPLLINEFIFDSFKFITIACFGIASVYKFINLTKGKKEDEE